MTATHQMIRLQPRERYEWVEREDAMWRGWERDGEPVLELVAKDGKKLKSGNGLIDITGVDPLFVIRPGAPGFDRVCRLFEPLVVRVADIEVAAEPMRVFELSPERVAIDLDRSEVVQSGDTVLKVRSAVVLGDALPAFMVVEQGPPYHFFFRGDVVEELQAAEAVNAFEIEIVGRLASEGVRRDGD